MIRFPWLLLLCFLLNVWHAHAYDVLCRNGDTRFHTEFRTGVGVDVGPPTQGDLAAARVCRAILTWDDQEIVIADQAVQVDLDMFGVDLGDGIPVAAFQVKNSKAECCMTYKIYSLEQPPKLLHTLRGGTYFYASDNNLNGRVEIWTDDAAAVDGFEGLRASQLQFPPTCVLRFDENKLLDVSSEFEPYFDQMISKIYAQIHPEQLQIFKMSDGKKPAAIKVQIFELVWAYLYSNREKDAWRVLAKMWPAVDLKRIRSRIVQTRVHGIQAQLDGVSQPILPLGEPISSHEAEHVKIYHATKKPAQPIMVRYYPPPVTQPLPGKLRVDLVVDFVGKVWSVKVSGKDKAAYDSIKRSTANWKFIPAFIDNAPVASRVRMDISLQQ